MAGVAPAPGLEPALIDPQLARRVPSRTSVSGNFVGLHVFCDILGVGLSVAYRRVSARLQYGCGTFADLHSGSCQVA